MRAHREQDVENRVAWLISSSNSNQHFDGHREPVTDAMLCYEEVSLLPQTAFHATFTISPLEHDDDADERSCIRQAEPSPVLRAAALWLTLTGGMSLILAAAALFLLTGALLPSSLLLMDSHEERPSQQLELMMSLGHIAQPTSAVVHVVAGRQTAKLALSHSSLAIMELDLSFATRMPMAFVLPRFCDDFEGALECVEWSCPGSKVRLAVTELSSDESTTCFSVSLTADDPHARLSACLQLENVQLYGGPSLLEQRWPAQHSPPLRDKAYVPGMDGVGCVAERFWLLSSGEAIYVQPDVPLFVTQDAGSLCLASEMKAPYHSPATDPASLQLVVCTAKDARHAFLEASRVLLGTPSAAPDPRMLRHPVWSTWARFKKNVSAANAVEFARDIRRNGFNNSQIEIDDRWQMCYGEARFDPQRFPDPRATIDTLHDLGFRVTIWTHPFINIECPAYKVARDLDLLVRRPSDNSTGTIRWWDGNSAGLLDFTSSSVVTWWKQRLERLKSKYGVDGFKYDAGEASFVPSLARLHGGSERLQPSSLTTAYSRAVAALDPGVGEVRATFAAQGLPLVVRMFDKNSVWGYENGLKALIPSLLNLNVVGYSTVMPDMIGGNGYGPKPDKELFIRWLQVCTFMPILQFSYAPWDYDEETVAISKKYVELHRNYSATMLELAERKVKDGSPINPPVWWIAPQDSAAQVIDSEFLLGESVLVAPVLERGATARDVYLPAGLWHHGLRPEERFPVRGPVWLRNYPAPLADLPYFILASTTDEY